MVHASDANGIVVIAQLRPMNVTFALPEAHLPALGKRLAAGGEVSVEAWDREQKQRLAAGRLLTIDNLVDTSTGTIKMKAEFANADESLFPNQFVNVRLLLGVKKDALIAPAAAVQRGAKGSFVYSVDASGTVSAVEVAPGPTDNDAVAVEVVSGKLEPGAKVVIDGADKLREGGKVEVITGEARQAAQKSEKGEGRRGKGKGGAGG